LSISTLTILRNFIEGEKPKSLTPFDMVYVTNLIVNDGELSVPSSTLQQQLNCSARTVRQSIQRLEQAGIIAIDYHRGYPNVVKLQATPKEKTNHEHHQRHNH
jgi:biotin operon repressor